MGIRPRGEGERDISRHDAAEKGERWPFGWGLGSGGFCFGCEAAFCRLAWVFGLRLRARARFSRLESESEGSESSDMASGEIWRFAAERVMGAK